MEQVLDQVLLRRFAQARATLTALAKMRAELKANRERSLIKFERQTR